MKVETAEGEKKYIWISGPAKISIIKGSIEINEATYSSETNDLVIHRNRSYTMIVKEKTSLNIQTIENGEIRNASIEEIETLIEWKKTVEKTVEDCIDEECIITIIADTDMGKTTLATMLANYSLQKNIPTYLIDADVGQSTIGLPGFVSMIKYDKPFIWPRFPFSEKTYYVGQITPLGKELEIIHGINYLLRSTPQKSIKIIDTDGWIKNVRALIYKAKLIQSTDTTHVIIITPDTPIENTYEKQLLKLIPEKTNTMLIKPPPARKTRTRSERMLLRGEKIVQFNAMTHTLVLPLAQHYSIGKINLGVGTPLSSEELRMLSQKIKTKVVYGEKIGNENILLVKGKPKTRLPNTIIYTINDLRNLLVALINSEGEHVGAGFIIGFNEKNQGIVIKTDYKGEVKGIFTGSIIVDNNTVRMK